MDKIPIKTTEEIKLMREAGFILGTILNKLRTQVKPGVDSFDLEDSFIKLCTDYSVIAACKGYAPSGFTPYPTGLCLSLNEESVHCFPVKGRKLKNGDLLTIDTVIGYRGVFVDSAITLGVGQISEDKDRIMRTAQKALYNAIECVKPGARIGDLSNIIQKTAYKEGYSVLKEYAGHGIGKAMHEAPEIPCFGKPNIGPILQAGMTLAIEPLVCENSNVLEHSNFWHTKTVDGGLFAQEEHTVLVTPDGYEILTKVND